MRAHQASVHLPFAAPHAFVLILSTTGVGASAHAIRGLILALRRVLHRMNR
jgi:hypothetical protein